MNKVYAANHPLRAQRDCYEVPEGSTVKEIVDLVDGNSGLRKHFVVHVGGRVVPQEYWQYVTPKANTNIAIRAVPMGGGDDKDPLRTILTIVVAVAAAFVTGGGSIAGYSGALFGGGASGAAIAGAALSIVGRLVVDAIAPPPTPDELGGGGLDRDDRRPSIENARNRPARYQPIPRVYGTTRFVPPYSVLPYTEVRGDDQYLHFAVCWGYGPLDIGQIKIGDTNIEEYENPKGGVGDKWLEISHNSGDGNWSNGQLISNDVSEQSLNILLENSNGFTARTTDVDTDEISVDITFPQGLVEITNQGDKKSRTVFTQIEYSPAGQNAWQSAVNTEGSIGPFTLSTPSYSRPARMGPTAVSKDLIYSVYLDLADNTVGSTVGSPTMYTITGRGGSIIVQSGATTPSVPVGTVKLAEVVTNKNGITDNGITSITNTARPTDEFGSSSDLIVSQNTSNSVSISSGSVIAYSGGLPTTASSTSAIRNTYKFKVAKGQYDVRLKRATSDSTDDRIRDQLVWSAFRSIKHTEPVDTGFANSVNLAQTQIIIKATDQLNGVVDQLNGVVSSIIPDYNSSNDTWEEVTTSNPASIYRDILQGNANKEPIPDSRIDLSTLEYFHGRSDAKDFYYNDVIQGGSVQDALKQVLSIARTSHTMIDGVHSLVIDEEKTDVVQHFTPRNSKNFSGTKRFSKQPHAMKVPFNNRELGYAQDEAIAYDDGYSVDGTNCDFLDENGQCNVATEFESVDIKGITDGEQAWRYGRYLLATNRLRPENYTLDVDLEHLVATRGDLVRITHDVPMFGLASGRVKSIQTSGTDTTGVTLDQELELAANTDYTVRFRLANGDTLTRDIAQVGTDTTTKSVTFSTAISTSSGPQIGDLAMFGLQNQETVDCIIKEIQSNGADWGATLTLVDHAQPAIDDSADSEIPEYVSNITENPFTRQIPPDVRIDEVRSDESALVRHKDGSLEETIMVSYQVPSNDRFQPESAQFRFRKAGQSGGWQYLTGQPQQGDINLAPVDTGDDYDVEARTLTRNGIAGNWVTVASGHTVIGKTTPPPDMTGLTAETTNWVDSGSKSYGIRLTWDENPARDLSRYEIRTDTNFGNKAGLLKRPKDETAELPITTAGTYTFYGKAIDQVKLYSTNATSTTITISAPGQPQVDEGFSGPDFKLTWSPATEEDFPVSFYEIRYGGPDFDNATPVDTVQAREIKFRADWIGSRTWRIAAYDVAGNRGASGSTTVQIEAPDAPPDLSAKVIAIDVLLNWNEVSGTLPTDRYKVYRNQDPDAAFGDAGTHVQTTVDGTFASVKEDTPQDYRYWITAVDTAGNESSPSTVRVTVEELNDFVVQGRFPDDFTGGTTSDTFVKEPGVNALIGPYDVSNTVDDHYSGYSTTDDIINDGYTYVLQPTRVTTGTYQNEYDINAVLSQTLITVSFDTTVLDGNPAVSVKIEGKENIGDAYTLIANNTQGLGNQIRYIRITLTVDSDSDDDLLQITNLETVARIRKVTSEDTVEVNAGDSDGTLGGTLITLDRAFLDIRAVKVSVKGDNAGYTAFADWNDVQGQDEIHVWAYDSNGNRVTTDISYTVRGVVG